MKLIVKIYSFNNKSISKLTKKIENKLKLLYLDLSGPVYLPTKQHKFTVLKSPHVNKKSREQFAMSIHKRLFVINNINSEQIDNIKYLLLYLKSLCAEGQIKIIYMPGKI